MDDGAERCRSKKVARVAGLGVARAAGRILSLVASSIMWRGKASSSLLRGTGIGSRASLWKNPGRKWFWGGSRVARLGRWVCLRLLSDAQQRMWIGGFPVGEGSSPSRMKRWPRGWVQMTIGWWKRRLAVMMAERSAMVPSWRTFRAWSSKLLSMLASDMPVVGGS
jgi:hypothetical protein